MSYSVKLEIYEGPLALLLKLIEQNKVDIYDIPIATITEQYLASLEEMVEVDLEVSADFLLLAATLINIKTRLLLPRPRVEEETEEEEDPRQELVNRLVEYKNFKALATVLEQRFEGSVPRIYFRKGQELEPNYELKATVAQLVRSFRVVWMQKENPEKIPVRIPEGDIDINEKMQIIEQVLEGNEHGLTLQDFFVDVINQREALVLFIALLELVRQRRVKAAQAEPFGPISIFKLRSQPDAG